MTPLWITRLLAIVIVLGEWTGLARGVFGVPIYAGVLDIALVAITSVVVINLLRRRDFPRITLLTVLIAGYMLLAAVEILNPNVPSLRAGLEGYRKTAFTMLAFFVVTYSGDVDAGRFFRLVAIGSVPAFLWATRQFIAPLPAELNIVASSGISPVTFHSGQLLRAFSPTAGPFHLGILGGAIMIVGIVLAVSRGRAWLLVAACAGLALGLSLTRANIVGAIAGCAVIAITATPFRARLRTAAYAAVPLGVAAIAVLFAVGILSLSPPSTATNGAPGSSPGPSTTTLGGLVSGVENPLQDKNLQFRFAYWESYAASIVQRPLIGYGTSSAADGFDHFYQGTGSLNFEPHSVYFKAALELGLGGLLLFLAILGSVAWSIFRAWSFDPQTSRTVLGILTLVAVAGITGPMLDAYPVNLLFWASCGWIAVKARQSVEAGRPGAAQPSVAG